MAVIQSCSVPAGNGSRNIKKLKQVPNPFGLRQESSRTRVHPSPSEISWGLQSGLWSKHSDSAPVGSLSWLSQLRTDPLKYSVTPYHVLDNKGVAISCRGGRAPTSGTGAQYPWHLLKADGLLRISFPRSLVRVCLAIDLNKIYKRIGITICGILNDHIWDSHGLNMTGLLPIIGVTSFQNAYPRLSM
jgi:hypothetical protein